MIKRIALLCMLAGSTLTCIAQREIPLYPGQIPNAVAAADAETNRTDKTVGLLVGNVSRPTLTIFQPPAGTANGTSVIICPGGGYGMLLINREGRDVAREFNKRGVTAFVLKYRLPNKQFLVNPAIGPLQDAQQAISMVRQHAAEWKVSPDRIGIMGFSAGGHLASTAGTHFNKAEIEHPAGISLRPDFMILVNPVISFMDSFGHIGSRNNLLGTSPDPVQVVLFSNEQQIDSTTPTAFLVHAEDDTVVPVENSISFYTALKKNKVPGALHIYQRGEHGFLGEPSFDEWFGRCIHWMNSNGWLTKK
jgi:acetyl esterase/lipase